MLYEKVTYLGLSFVIKVPRKYPRGPLSPPKASFRTNPGSDPRRVMNCPKEAIPKVTLKPDEQRQFSLNLLLVFFSVFFLMKKAKPFSDEIVTFRTVCSKRSEIYLVYTLQQQQQQ